MPIWRRRHAAFDARRGMAIGGDGDVGRLLHQRQLGGRLDHPAAAHDRGAGADLDAGQGAPKPVDGEEADRLLDPDRAGRAAVGENAGDGAQRILMLVPDADLGGDLQALADRGLLEMRRHDRRLAVARQDRGGQPLAPPPLDAGEIGHRRAGLDQQRGKPRLVHQPLRLGDAGEIVLAGDRNDVARHGLQPRRLGEQPIRCQRGDGGPRGAEHEVASVHRHGLEVNEQARLGKTGARGASGPSLICYGRSR